MTPPTPEPETVGAAPASNAPTGAPQTERLIRPTSEAEISEALRQAAAQGRTVGIRGGGSRRGFGPAREAAETLSTKLLLGVRLYEPAALTLMARAGTPLREIVQTLDAHGQQLPFEPIDHRPLLGLGAAEPTIGGATAVGASGPRRIQAGGLRDALIGVRFVNGAGEPIAAGGRVMKNVTGYDLSRMHAGAFGALGVLTEVCFKVSPKPEAAATVLVHRLDDRTAVSALAAALGSPFDVTGAAHVPGPQTVDGADAVTMIRLEGFADSVAYRAQALRDRLGRFGETSVIEDVDACAAGWAYIRDALPFAHRDGAVWRISVKPTDGPALVQTIARARPAAALYDWGGGLVWLLTPEAGGDGAADAGAALIRAETDRVGGRALLARASDAVRRAVGPLPPEPPGRAALAQKVRRAFDPHDIFNPERRVA